jgi:hypothetical protein
VVHWGASYTRPDKLRAVVDERLVKKHLRVCWENRDKKYNCSKCEKCIRTMLTIEALGKLDEYEVFKPEHPLAKVVEEMPFISNPAIDLYDDILDACPDFELSRQIRELIKRSRTHYKNKKGLLRFLAKVDQKLLRRLKAGHPTS